MNAIAAFIHAIIAYNIPLLFGTVGEIVVEKSGSLNLGVEGIMAVSAIVGYLVGCFTNSLLIGLVAAFAVGSLMGLLFAALTVSLQANQNITGLTLTTFGLGAYFFIGTAINSAKKWPSLDQSPALKAGFADLHIPFLSDLPVLGDGLFQHNVLVYLGIVIAIGVWFYFNRTAPGLRLRAVGENPGAADSVGINVKRYKYLHIMLGCGIMGIGGYYMGLHMEGSFSATCWINGYGWIAIALVIFANWNATMAILGTFVFGFFQVLKSQGSALANEFPGALSWLSKIPIPLYEALPFIITAIVLIATSIRKREGSGLPAGLGINYFREER